MKRRISPVHPFLPSDEDRNVAITHIVRHGNDSTALSRRLELPSHFVTFRRGGKTVTATYTPTSRSNMQTSDRVNVSTSQAASY